MTCTRATSAAVRPAFIWFNAPIISASLCSPFDTTDRMNMLGEKLGPLLLQFPRFSKYEMQADEFSRRLRFFLNRLRDLPTFRFVVEIRNRTWRDKRFTDLLREYNVQHLFVGDDLWKCGRPHFHTYVVMRIMCQHDQKGCVSELFSTSWAT